MQLMEWMVKHYLIVLKSFLLNKQVQIRKKDGKEDIAEVDQQIEWIGALAQTIFVTIATRKDTGKLVVSGIIAAQ